MTSRRARPVPSAEQHLSHGLRALPCVVVAFLLVEVATGLLFQVYDTPDLGAVDLGLTARQLLAVAAAAALVWRRPRVAAALTALVATFALTVGPTGEELWLLLVLGVTAAVRARPRVIVLLLAAETGFAVGLGIWAEQRHLGWGWAAAVAYLVAAGLALAIGLAARRLLRLRDRRRLRVAQLERERTEIRGVERERLADELQVVVSEGLERIEGELAEMDHHRPGLVELRARLSRVDGHSRSLLGQLRTLLLVLRDDPALVPTLTAAVGRRHRGGSPEVRRVLASAAAFAAVGVFLVSVGTGATTSWDALATGLLCLLVILRLGPRGLGLVVLVAAGSIAVLARTDVSDPWSHVVLTAYASFLAVVAGLVARHLVLTRRDAVQQLGELSHALAQVESEERGAAARELHDVVAHQLSLTTMLVMATSLSEDPDELSRTLGQIRGTTTAAHDELTALVAGMRGRTPEETPVLPVSPVRCAEVMASRLREHGFQPVLAIDPVADALEPTTQRTLARIMQEATTNIVRYAPAASRCDYTLGVDGPEVTLTVASPVVAGGRRSDQSLGWGLRGAQERVELTHGTFRAVQEGDRWVLTVSLPTTSAEPASVVG